LKEATRPPHSSLLLFLGVISFLYGYTSSLLPLLEMPVIKFSGDTRVPPLGFHPVSPRDLSVSPDDPSALLEFSTFLNFPSSPCSFFPPLRNRDISPFSNSSTRMSPFPRSPHLPPSPGPQVDPFPNLPVTYAPMVPHLPFSATCTLHYSLFQLSP